MKNPNSINLKGCLLRGLAVVIGIFMVGIAVGFLKLSKWVQILLLQ